MAITYSVKNDGRYVRVIHSKLGLIATGVIDKNNNIGDISFLDEEHRKVNAIRIPAMKALIAYQKELKKLSNPSIPKNKWLKASAIKITNGRILIRT